MVTRWQVTKAVRASELPAPARLIMLTLADVAEVGTGEIPPQWTPSLAVLAQETGLDRRTVQRHLGALEAAGWVVRTRPDGKGQWRGERVQYRLALPSGVEPPAAEAAQDRPGGGTESPELAAQSHIAGGTEPPLETDHPDQGQIVGRADVEQVCQHLADRIEANGSKRPTITKAWRDAARRLIDKDGRSVEQITRAIDWCQEDDFWRGNVMSMPKLREQYDRLRLAAQRGATRNGRSPELPPSNAPVPIARDEQCPEHRGQRKGRCRYCRADAKARGAA